MSVMLYKAGGNKKLHGLDCATVIVPEDGVKACLADGWAMSPAEAHATKEPKKRKRRTKAEIAAQEE